MADFPFSNTGAVPKDLGTLKKYEACNIATTENIADLGAVAVGSGTGDSIDGVTVLENFRVLVKDQTDASENGIYVANDGTGLTRASDFDAYNEIDPAFIVPVLAGTAGGGKAFELDDPAALVVVGTTDLEFTEYTAWKAAAARTL